MTLNNMDEVGAAALAQNPTFHLGDSSALSLATVVGKARDGLKTVHEMLDGAATAVSALPSKDDVKDQAAAAITAAGLATSAQLVDSVLLPIRLTRAVDNIMDHVYGYSSISSAVYPFPIVGTTVAYLTTYGYSGATNPTAPAINEYQVVAGQNVITLFDFAKKRAHNVALLSPAQKLTIFLRAVFGIKYTDFQTISFANPVDREDSGTVLNNIFTYVLGATRNGTGGTNKFGGTGIFNNINKTGSTTPSTYFSALTITGTSAADIDRLKALIADLDAIV